MLQFESQHRCRHIITRCQSLLSKPWIEYRISPITGRPQDLRRREAFDLWLWILVWLFLSCKNRSSDALSITDSWTSACWLRLQKPLNPLAPPGFILPQCAFIYRIPLASGQSKRRWVTVSFAGVARLVPIHAWQSSVSDPLFLQMCIKWDVAW